MERRVEVLESEIHFARTNPLGEFSCTAMRDDAQKIRFGVSRPPFLTCLAFVR